MFRTVNPASVETFLRQDKRHVA